MQSKETENQYDPICWHTSKWGAGYDKSFGDVNVDPRRVVSKRFLTNISAHKGHTKNKKSNKINNNPNKVICFGTQNFYVHLLFKNFLT